MFISGFVRTGNFSKEKFESLLETHQKMCKTSFGANICNGVCETTISQGRDYLIVGTVLSQQYQDKPSDLKNDVKKCTDF